MNTTQLESIALEIRTELARLKADTDYNAYSGLSVEIKDGNVSIYEDYDRASLPDPLATLAQLKALDPIDWDSHDNTESAFQPIWTVITLTGGY